MGDESYQSYRDDRGRSLGLSRASERAVQQQHLESVASRIGAAIVQFIRLHDGHEFYADDLRQHVIRECGPVAPGSADRILRDLRLREVISYRVVNRARSLYRAGRVG